VLYTDRRRRFASGRSNWYGRPRLIVSDVRAFVVVPLVAMAEIGRKTEELLLSFAKTVAGRRRCLLSRRRDEHDSS
jgi:hypothetical protein